ncbi:hypothetical protein [Weissella confusa]|uniref:hypothetical protein n=1 Tax=Weissella confusa TaxID=1583 RepID=UPI0018F20D2F|nr:hypothetical protein [Weissella confusa]MBJ7642424.1 hypothetical protein [Weissella confusa]
MTLKRIFQRIGRAQRPDVDYFDYLMNNIFSFGRLNQLPYTKAMAFHVNGEISFGGERSVNEAYWRIQNDELLLLDEEGKISTSFLLPKGSDVPKSLVGDFKLEKTDEPIQHELRLMGQAEVLDYLTNALSVRVNQSENKTKELLKAPILKTQHARVRLLFILNAAETLEAVLPLIKAAKVDSRFEVKVIQVARLFRNQVREDAFEQLASRLKAEDIQTVNLSASDEINFSRIKNWQPDFVLRQSEWDQDFPDEYAIENFYWTKVIYVPYIVLEEFIENPNSNLPLFTMDFYEHVWRMYLAMEPSSKAMNTLDKTFISSDIFKPVGSMKAEMIRNVVPSWPENNLNKRVLWMPHHSIGDGWFNMGTFNHVYTDMLNWTRNHPNISVVLNPHPSLPDVIGSSDFGSINTEKYNQFLDEWNALPNAGFIVGESNYPYSAAADVVLTDGISSLYEVQLQDTPIVYLERFDHVAFSEIGEKWMTGVHREQSLDGALNSVETLLGADDSLREQQIENAKMVLSETNVATKILDDMVAEFESEKLK